MQPAPAAGITFSIDQVAPERVDAAEHKSSLATFEAQKDYIDKTGAGPVYQSSLSAGDSVMRSHRGFVETVLTAYNKHHALVIRPDDVWMAILQQFNFYVNGNAEALRKVFVAHEGKRDLTIDIPVSTAAGVDYAGGAQRFVDLVAENLVDASICDLLLPNFTTTTDSDRIASSITVMSIVKAYFNFGMQMQCGIPSITLLGTPNDWQSVLDKMRGLAQLVPSPEMGTWFNLMEPIAMQFLNAALGHAHAPFWQRMCHLGPRFSGGSRDLHGWLSSFAAFNDRGKLKLQPEDSMSPRRIGAAAFQALLDGTDPAVRAARLHGERYFRVDFTGIAAALAFVPINMRSPIDGEFKIMAFAGQICAAVVGEHGDTLQCRIDWAFVRIDQGMIDAFAEVDAAYKAVADEFSSARQAYWDAGRSSKLPRNDAEHAERIEAIVPKIQQVEAMPVYARRMAPKINDGWFIVTTADIREFIDEIKGPKMEAEEE